MGRLGRTQGVTVAAGERSSAWAVAMASGGQGRELGHEGNNGCAFIGDGGASSRGYCMTVTAGGNPPSHPVACEDRPAAAVLAACRRRMRGEDKGEGRNRGRRGGFRCPRGEDVTALVGPSEDGGGRHGRRGWLGVGSTRAQRVDAP